ncbi:hypothetical protein DENSPDRAFT_840112 [Dentipellis sp. KUC8613]|nr:hypothetical protein DENSPDRAFT_840112 [Dentipellis sp. KUC8613]
MLRAFVAYVQADRQWTLASVGLSEDGWRMHGRMTNQEIHDYVALMGTRDSGDATPGADHRVRITKSSFHIHEPVSLSKRKREAAIWTCCFLTYASIQVARQ